MKRKATLRNTSRRRSKDRTHQRTRASNPTIPAQALKLNIITKRGTSLSTINAIIVSDSMEILNSTTWCKINRNLKSNLHNTIGRETELRKRYFQKRSSQMMSITQIRTWQATSWHQGKTTFINPMKILRISKRHQVRGKSNSLQISKEHIKRVLITLVI